MSKRMIVKLQVPLASNDPNAGALVYSRDRSFHTFIPMDEAVEEVMRGRPKAFFYVNFDKKRDEFAFEGEAPWQEW